jgi:hypothetical protein
VPLTAPNVGSGIKASSVCEPSHSASVNQCASLIAGLEPRIHMNRFGATYSSECGAEVLKLKLSKAYTGCNHSHSACIGKKIKSPTLIMHLSHSTTKPLYLQENVLMPPTGTGARGKLKTLLGKCYFGCEHLHPASIHKIQTPFGLICISLIARLKTLHSKQEFGATCSPDSSLVYVLSKSYVGCKLFIPASIRRRLTLTVKMLI